MNAGSAAAANIVPIIDQDGEDDALLYLQNRSIERRNELDACSIVHATRYTSADLSKVENGA